MAQPSQGWAGITTLTIPRQIADFPRRPSLGTTVANVAVHHRQKALHKLPEGPNPGKAQESLSSDFIFLHIIVTTISNPHVSPFISSLFMMNVFFDLSSCFLRIITKMFKLQLTFYSLFFFRSYFFISLQFYLSIKSCNVFVNVPVTQLRIVLD